MPTGKVAWFNPVKGFGFITPDDGTRDVFVHLSALERIGLDTLPEGQRLAYEIEEGSRNRISAIALKVL